MQPRLKIWSASVLDVRKRLGMSQDAFAKEIGVSQGMLSSWEAGRHGPSITYMRRIVAADPEHRTSEELFPDEAIDIRV